MQEKTKEGASLYVTYDSMKRPVHISIKESGLSGFLAFMREDTAEVLRQGYDPNLWMCHYRFPDRRQIPEIRPQSNDDYLERLSRAARSAGIRAEHQIAMTDMLYCLRHSIVPLTPEADPAKLALRTDYPDPLGTFGVELPSPGADIPEYRAYTAVETAPGVVFFSDTQHGKMQFEKYMDYHASNFFNPEQQTPSLKIYDVIARPADMAPITDRCFAEAEDGQERRNRFAEAYADRELLRQGSLRREFDMRRSTVIGRLHREQELLRDYIVPIGTEHNHFNQTSAVSFRDEGTVTLTIPQGAYSLHGHAIGQLAARMNIPSRYLREMAAGEPWQRALAADMLNQHSIHTPRARVLLRTVGTEVRGVLSDSYRRIDSQSSLIAFLQEAKRQGAVICDAYMSDTKVWAETILPTPLTIPTTKNGHVVIFMGARFSTSDYGDGALDMRAFLLNGVCLNGMVRESVWKQIHLGAKLPGNLRLSDRTYELDTQATVSAVRDLARQLYSRETIRKKAIEIQRASETDVDFTAELQRLVKNNRLLKNESEQVEQLLMQNRPEDGLQGEATLWKLTQALTAFARDAEPARSREMQELSGELFKKIA